MLMLLKLEKGIYLNLPFHPPISIYFTEFVWLVVKYMFLLSLLATLALKSSLFFYWFVCKQNCLLYDSEIIKVPLIMLNISVIPSSNHSMR